MSDQNPISGKVGLDTTDFKTGIAEASRELRVLESGFRASAAALGDWSNDASGLEMRIGALTKEIEVQQRKVSLLRGEYERVAAEKGANSKAAQDLEIRLNKETETLNNMQAELGETSQALQDFGQVEEDVADAGDSFSLSLTDIKSGFEMAAKAAQIAGKIYDATAGKFLSYAMTVKDLSRNLQINAEETSRLIQLGDDYAITAEQMTSALEMAVKRGFAPTIENLAELSDEVLAIEDPTERAAMLSEKFGKSWETLTPILYQGGDAIRGQAAAISDKLVLDQEQIDQAEALRRAQDDLNDEVEALEITFGQKLTPTLTGSVRIIREGIEGWERAAWAIGVLTGQVDDNTEATEDNTDAQKDNKKATDAADHSSGIYGPTLEELTGTTEELTGGISQYVREMLAAADTTPHYVSSIGIITAAIEAEKQALADVNFALDGPVATAYENYSTKMDDLRTKHDDIVAQLAILKKQGYADTSDKVKGLTQDLADNETAQADLEAQMAETTKEIIFQKLSAGLTSEALLEYARQTGMISESDYNLAKATGELNQMYLDGKITVDDLTLATSYLQTALEDGTLTAEEMQTVLNRFKSREFTYTFNGEMTGDWPSGSGGSGTSVGNSPGQNKTDSNDQTGKIPYAGGGSFVIPPGYNESFALGNQGRASSGEIVTVTPPGVMGSLQADLNSMIAQISLALHAISQGMAGMAQGGAGPSSSTSYSESYEINVNILGGTGQERADAEAGVQAAMRAVGKA